MKESRKIAGLVRHMHTSSMRGSQHIGIGHGKMEDPKIGDMSLQKVLTNMHYDSSKRGHNTEKMVVKDDGKDNFMEPITYWSVGFQKSISANIEPTSNSGVMKEVKVKKEKVPQKDMSNEQKIQSEAPKVPERRKGAKLPGKGMPKHGQPKPAFNKAPIKKVKNDKRKQKANVMRKRQEMPKIDKPKKELNPKCGCGDA